MAKDLSLSPQAKNSCWTKDVQERVTEILLVKSWTVTFKNNTVALLTPVPDPTAG
jgi:hypothetical protein